MIKPTRVLMDMQAQRCYYIDSQNNAYADNRFKKHLKCGLGHNMWSQAEYIICDKCDTKVQCKVIT